jgi:hypothetical protein
MPTCYDVNGWHLNIGSEYDCDHFARNSNYCNEFGSSFTSNLGMTAKEACCTCGGGLKTTMNAIPNEVNENEGINKAKSSSSGEKKTYNSIVMIGLGLSVMINAFL